MAILSKIFGSCRCTQTIFGAVKPGKAMLPVISRKRGSASSSAASFGRAAVVPEDAGAERPVGLVEQRRAVHVAGEADAAHALQLLRMVAAERVDRARGRGDPALGVLLRPAGMRALDRRAARFARRRSRWSASISTAFTDEVPISMPRYMEPAPPPVAATRAVPVPVGRRVCSRVEHCCAAERACQLSRRQLEAVPFGSSGLALAASGA